MTQTTQKIPYGWIKTKLGKICKNKGQYGANAPSVPYSPNLPSYIRITDIDDDGKYIFSNRVSVNISDYKNYLLEKGDIVFARTGATTGKTYLYNENDGQFVFAGFLIKFSPNTNLINPYYLKLSTEIPFYKSWIKVMSVRSGQPGVNAEEYAKYPLLLPPLAEQEKIAEILGAWDSAIEKLTALIAAKRLQKKGLMQKLLTAQIRLPGFTDEWQKVKLGDLFSKSLNKNKNSKKIQVLTNSATQGVVLQEDYFDREIVTKENLCNYYSVQKGDFIYNPRISKNAPAGPIKRNHFTENGCISPLYTIFRIKTEKSNPLFYEIYFESNLWAYEAYKVANYGARSDRMNITNEDFFNMRLPYPPLSEQKAIADILSKADEEIDLLTRKLDLLQSQKKGLMQQLLTGKIRVKVA